MVRIAVIGTPRSGNTWIRGVVADTLGCTHYAVHNYRDLPTDLAADCVLQIHWPREPGFQTFLRTEGFKIVIPARHPIDVLVSVLHFVRREPLTARWLEGNADIPHDLAAETPASPGFQRYALSYGAENLLSISYQWSFDRDAILVHYEKLVAEPRAGFRSLIERLGGLTEGVEAALGAHAFAHYRNMPNRHGWQANPGVWRQLVPRAVAQRIFLRHRPIFDRLGYQVPFYALSKRRATKMWQQMAI
jgi:hypothetical protein